VSTIGVDRQAVTGREMAAKHLPATAAIQADDIIAMNGSPDWHREVSPYPDQDQFCDIDGVS